MNDRDLHRSVLLAIESDPALAEQEIGIAVRDGVVTLSGYLDADVNARSVEHILTRIPGVAAVVQTARVRTADQRRHSDTDIAHRVAAHVAQRLGSPNNGLVARVERGWVTLEGEVDLVHDRTDLEETIRRLPGVRGVCNCLTVRPPETVHRIQAKIDVALSRLPRPVIMAFSTGDYPDSGRSLGPSTPCSMKRATLNDVAPERSK